MPPPNDLPAGREREFSNYYSYILAVHGGGGDDGGENRTIVVVGRGRGERGTGLCFDGTIGLRDFSAQEILRQSNGKGNGIN